MKTAKFAAATLFALLFALPAMAQTWYMGTATGVACSNTYYVFKVHDSKHPQRLFDRIQLTCNVSLYNIDATNCQGCTYLKKILVRIIPMSAHGHIRNRYTIGSMSQILVGIPFNNSRIVPTVLYMRWSDLGKRHFGSPKEWVTADNKYYQ